MRARWMLLFTLALGACGDDETAVSQIRDEPPPVAAATAQPAAQDPTATAAAETRAPEPGESTYLQYCADCHDRGEGHPGTMRLAARLEHAVLRTRKDLSPDYVRWVVRNGYQMMPAFRPTEITDGELDALARFVSAATLAAGYTP